VGGVNGKWMLVGGIRGRKEKWGKKSKYSLLLLKFACVAQTREGEGKKKRA